MQLAFQSSKRAASAPEGPDSFDAAQKASEPANADSLLNACIAYCMTMIEDEPCMSEGGAGPLVVAVPPSRISPPESTSV